jgi:bifunctional non-homologous end joining protein LigD
MQSANLYYKEGSSDKVYHATIEKENEGYVVNFAYGRRGSTLKTGSKTPNPISLEKAQDVYNKLLKEKLSKGYRHMDDFTGSSIPTVKELPDTPTEIQCVLLNPIDQKTAKELLDHSDWIVQEKFDGIRFMLQKKNDQISAINRKGKFVSIPNNIQRDAQNLPNCFLDGELIGETLYVFDILEINDNCVRNESLENRINLLENLPSTKNIIVVKTVRENKIDFYNEIEILHMSKMLYKPMLMQCFASLILMENVLI